MTVTVCIPAYRAGRFLADTLNSVIAQTYADLVIAIGIDPADSDGTGSPEDTLAALTPFLSDARVRVTRNPARLGWDGNIRALLERVDTPYYAILPHDDVWDPRYVSILLTALESQPSASVAYGDLYAFGPASPWRHAVELPGTADVRAQLLPFLLQGAEAMPWRGVTRSSRLPSIGGFPTDGNRGFAVECEYALALVLAGPVVHVPRTLYYKRFHPEGVITASRARLVEPNRVELERAWRNHADRMRRLLEAGLANLSDHTNQTAATDRFIWAAFTAAMLRRCPLTHLPPEDVEPAEELVASLDASDDEAARPVISKLRVVLWRQAAALGDVDRALAHAEAAGAANPLAADACLALASALSDSGRPLEALDLVAQAERAFPGGLGPFALRKTIYKKLGWS